MCIYNDGAGRQANRSKWLDGQLINFTTLVSSRSNERLSQKRKLGVVDQVVDQDRTPLKIWLSYSLTHM